jgi:membrane-associated phospholipid phosphatase
MGGATGLRIAECGLTAIRNPQSALPKGHPRNPLTMRLFTTLALCFALIAPPCATTQVFEEDSAKAATQPLFTAEDAFFAGGVVFATLAIAPLDKRFADYLQGSPQTNRFFRRLSVTVEAIAQPGAYLIGAGLYGIGRLGGNERMAELGLRGTEAIVFGLLLTNALKVGAGRQRPYVNRDKPHNFGFLRGWKQEQYRSFPSGHSLIAFAAAAAVTEETRHWWPKSAWYIGPAMYGGATLVALSRMYNNRHWASDVMIGGLVGTFAGLKVVKYHRTHPDNRVDRWLLGVMATPEGDAGWVARPLVMKQVGYK